MQAQDLILQNQPSVSAREYDINDWPEIKDNPISAVGVYPYLGAQVSDQFAPDEVIPVLRPAEELADPEAIQSFRLKPWIDDHDMLGSPAEGLTPAEEKIVHGVIGEQVWFDTKTGMLRANLKCFSESMKDLIESGKKELSCGYRCIYEVASGVYNGVHYKAIQRKIRANHIALVEEGRMGQEVAVMDGKFKFTFDQAEKPMDPKKDEAKDEIAEKKTEAKDEASEASTHELLREILAFLKGGATAADEKECKKAEDTDKGDTKRTDGDSEKPAGDAATEEKKEEKAEDSKAMDAKIQAAMDSFTAELAQRDALAQDLSCMIGEFEYKTKKLSDVIAYGMDKLDLKAPKGQELTAITAFLNGARKTLSPLSAISTGMDSKDESSLDKYLKETK